MTAPGRVENTVFLSYRRTNAAWALAIFQNLTAHGYDVFVDFLGIGSGDFESVILENIRARAHFVVLLTPSALERCSSSSDWLRREIETALDSKRNIVPLTLEGFDFSSPEVAAQLTGRLAALKSYNALNVPTQYFLEAMKRLREVFLSVPVAAVLHPPSLPAQRAAIEGQKAALAAPPVKRNELAAQERYERAVIRAHCKDFEGALESAAEAVRLAPGSADAILFQGLMHLMMQAPERAKLYLDEAIRLNPVNVDGYEVRAKMLLEQGDLEGALQDVEEIIRLNPSDAEAFWRRGMIRLRRGDRSEALRDFDEAVRLNPDHAGIRLTRGMDRYTKGDLDGAIEDLTSTIGIDPEMVEPYRWRGMARRDKNDFDGALRDFEVVTTRAPSVPDVYFDRAQLYRRQGKNSAAVADFAAYLRLGGGKKWGNEADVKKMILELKQ